MGMTTSVRMSLAVLACGTLSACAGDTNGGVDCASRPEPVASASTWDGLKDAMLDYTGRGRVASVRTQARGEGARHALHVSDRHVRRVVDLLNRNGRLLVQVVVRRTDAGSWRADILSQCD
jgi:hypothetical protein